MLQKIERNLSTTVTSSLAVAHNIADLNKILATRTNLPTLILLAPIYVESLFTRIPQPQLLTIVEDQLNLFGLDEETRQQYLKYI